MKDNDKNTDNTDNPNTHETMEVLEKFLEPQLPKAPAFGTIGIELIFRDSRLDRIKTKIEASVQLNSKESGFTEPV